MKTHFYRDKTKRKDFRWKIVGRNGKIVGASSEGFTTLGKCKANYRMVTLKAYNNVVVDDTKAKKAAARKAVVKKVVAARKAARGLVIHP